MQGSIQLPGFQEALDAVNAEVAAVLHFFSGESGYAIGVIEFLSTFAGSPLRLETRQRTPDLAAIDAVTALVRPAAGSVFNMSSRAQSRRRCRPVR